MVRETNLAAIRFYGKYRFTKVRLVRGYYENGGDGILMKRVLGAGGRS
jgi:ribosomal protein S18 acetylase RimI-like enzyme